MPVIKREHNSRPFEKFLIPKDRSPLRRSARPRAVPGCLPFQSDLMVREVRFQRYTGICTTYWIGQNVMVLDQVP